MPIEINDNLYFTRKWYGETSYKFTYSFNCLYADISDKILNEINFLSNYNFHINPIESFLSFSLKIYMVHWHSECIAVGHHNALQLTTVQLG